MKHTTLPAIFFLLVCLLHPFTGECQNTRGSLAVQRFSDVSPSQDILRLKTLKQDTNKANLLIRISGKYWRKKKGSERYLDSSLFYSRNAFMLCSALQFTEGRNESSFLICKASMDKEDLDAAKKILEQVNGEQHIRLLLVVAEHYSFLPGQQTENLNHATPYIESAVAEAKSIHSLYWKAEALELMAKNSFQKGDPEHGKQLFFQIIAEYHDLNDRAQEARYWTELARYLPVNDDNYQLKARSFKQAAMLYSAISDKKNAAEAMLDLGDHVYSHNLDSAVAIYLQAIKTFKAAGEVNLLHVYLSLSETYDDLGNFNQALAYALLALKNLQSIHDNSYLAITDVLIGNIYRELGEVKQSTVYYKLGLELAGSDTKFSYILVKYYADGLVKLRRPEEALKYVTAYVKNRPPANAGEEAIKASALANCHSGLGSDKLAEQFYLQMIGFIEAYTKDKNKQIFLSDEISIPQAYYEIAKFYTDRQKYNNAAPYLKKASNYNNASPLLKKEIAYMQFKSDSAAGNYLKALASFQKTAAYKDSIYRVERLKELMAMRVQYETAQKEKDYELLEKEGELQKQDLERAKQQKYFTYIGLVGLLFLLAILYNRYMLKQKSNRLLTEQKDLIDSKNTSLQVLVKEKEWLLREIHHRVKNNLQIITSLLQSQPRYLRDEAALDAIEDSKNRVRAMSLIHQKLYISNNATLIYMPDYLDELISNLKSSFKIGPAIFFDVDISPVSLDIAYAIPVGLIVNETITNAIKYAFPRNGNNSIKIRLSAPDAKSFSLSVSDNGVGLPANFDIGQSNSFGIVLIKGMTEDLDGILDIAVDKGTHVNIIFKTASI
ncbi:sensor histidine kinase [Mucilaginibacter sp. cycad4]|uniref:tetratricopeptide repeat-containing sensor histidine kinase n=1 Tax=Mucilaginibacter sp. cycad4 TaxID=3342096 RepID=UPI002AAB45F6|nr:sensor histidine kinase [Mucilaginibacter gossypii]WPU99125.1 sensor histidine kinase [Mucilaginibacter gossypii]